MRKLKDSTIELTDSNCTRKGADAGPLRDLQIKLHSRPDLSMIASSFGNIGNETRLKILYLLGEAGELCVCDLADVMGHSVSAVSHQLRKLKEGHLVKTRKESPTIYYSLSDDSFLNVLINLIGMGGMLPMETPKVEG